MPLINCPNCNEEVSDKAEKCVHCGYEITQEKQKTFCSDCGNEIKGGEEFCGKCGCPVEKKEDLTAPMSLPVQQVIIQKSPKNKKKVKIIIFVTIALLVLGGITFGVIAIFNNQKEKREQERYEQEQIHIKEEYKNNYSSISFHILLGLSEAEDCGSIVNKVWHNSIWKENDSETNKYTKKNGRFYDDFNDALKALYADAEFSEKVKSLETNQDTVQDYMKKLKNPPTEWKEAYDDLKTLYDDYLTLTNMCINPSGSLMTYTNNFNNADTRAANGYEKIKAYLGS